jgi:hypothetical protein
MALAFSGQTPVNLVFNSNGTRLQLVNQLETALSSVGWTAISGAGSSDWVYESAMTPLGQKIRLEGLDPGGAAVCAKFRLKSGPPFNLTGQDWFLNPVNGTAFRIWANKYQFFFFTSGPADSSRSLVCGGVPYIWPFMDFIFNTDPYCGWSHGNGGADASATLLAATFRRLYHLGQNGMVNYSSIWTGAVQTNVGSGALFGCVTLCPQGSVGVGSCMQYEDGSWSLNEPILCWPTGTASTGNGTRHGQIWDGCLISKVYTSEDIRSIAGNNWMAITHNNGAATPTGTLMLLVP